MDFIYCPTGWCEEEQDELEVIDDQLDIPWAPRL